MSGLPGSTREIAIDVLRDMIYVATGNSILCSNLDGGGTTTIVTLDFGDPTGLAIDVLDEKLYWTQPSKLGSVARIQRAKLDGTGIETLVTVVNCGFSPIALDVPIPEPSTLALLSMGALAFLACTWRKRRWR